MKTLVLRAMLFATLALLAQPSPTWAQPDRPAANDRLERLERLERRLDELAERQEQFMRREGAQMQRQGQPGQMMPASPNAPARLQAGPPPAQAEQNPGAKVAKDISGLIGLLCLIGLICNILLAIWIYTDIRKRNEGSGIFVALAIFAGIPAALIYALTRIGDRKT